MIVTDTDGSTRTYSLNVMVDTSDIYIKNVTSSDNRVTSIEMDEDDENYITIYGKAKSLNDIKDSLKFEFSDDVTKHELTVDDENDGSITLSSEYGGTVTYDIYYYYDYGSLAVDSITAKEQSEVTIDDCWVTYSTIYVDVQNVNNDVKEIFDKYLDVKFKSDTITGEVIKTDDGDYKYVITDKETKETRSYNIRCDIYYSGEYRVNDISGPDGILTEWDNYQEDNEYYIELWGTANTLEELIGQLKFSYGEKVLSGEIKTQDDGTYLVLKCKDDITYSYQIQYYHVSEDED